MADKYVRARNSLFRIMKIMEVPVNVNFDLFETYVAYYVKDDMNLSSSCFFKFVFFYGS